jgi:hypothetical protein
VKCGLEAGSSVTVWCCGGLPLLRRGWRAASSMVLASFWRLRVPVVWFVCGPQRQLGVTSQPAQGWTLSFPRSGLLGPGCLWAGWNRRGGKGSCLSRLFGCRERLSVRGVNHFCCVVFPCVSLSAMIGSFDVVIDPRSRGGWRVCVCVEVIARARQCRVTDTLSTPSCCPSPPPQSAGRH